MYLEVERRTWDDRSCSPYLQGYFITATVNFNALVEGPWFISPSIPTLESTTHSFTPISSIRISAVCKRQSSRWTLKLPEIL